MGFLAAMRLRFEAWRPLRDLNARAGEFAT
jgi:hypothetical protein